ncbi:MAG: hypothetical protein K9W42_01930 [Candidatus Heimdallarchaeota archaeon]|nr:hypothetical protein [Candidatus Heimdallarchaeota archaeon]
MLHTAFITALLTKTYGLQMNKPWKMRVLYSEFCPLPHKQIPLHHAKKVGKKGIDPYPKKRAT